MNDILVSASWLNERLSDENLVILDTSSLSNVSAEASYTPGMYIPGARKYELKENFADKNSSLPSTFPSADQFEVEYRKLGINDSSIVVVYDNIGVYTSPRGWWMLKTAGHKNVKVLDGGLPEWISQGYSVTDKAFEVSELGNFNVDLEKSKVKSYSDVLANVEQNDFLVVDARSDGRFRGVANEPRKHLKSGHIPNSVNIPFKSVLENGKYKSLEALTQIFDSVIPDEKELVFSCGSGTTACIILLASELVGDNQTAVFDGSWTEWAERQGLFCHTSS